MSRLSVELPISGWALKRFNPDTRADEWLYATCGLSEARFVPMFLTRKEATAYKAARMAGSGWLVARVWWPHE